MNQHEFSAIMGDAEYRRRLHAFLKEIFRLYPEEHFFALLRTESGKHANDSAVYEVVRQQLPSIKPFLSALTYALPALRKQQRVLAGQTISLCPNRNVNGYIEIGSTGRYHGVLRGPLGITGPVLFLNDAPPQKGLAAVLERKSLRQPGRFLPLDYSPIDSSQADTASFDLVFCPIGLHHCPDALLPEFLASLRRVLRPGGRLILREHDVREASMATFVSLVHTVFNLGLDFPWSINAAEYRSFRSMDEWSGLLRENGFAESGGRLHQEGDPTDNLLTAYQPIS